MNKEITGSIIGCISYLFCSICLMGFWLYALKSKKPINFWAGDKINPRKITDVKKYNRANGLMWIIYGILWIVCSIIPFFNELVAGMICLGLGV
ncbi:MAG: hypothetical protein J6Y13_01395, partial [Treponema sp.]|nr:hypothetical protein [Treponema sp.]